MRLISVLVLLLLEVVCHAAVPFFLSQPSDFKEFTDLNISHEVGPAEIAYRFAVTPLEGGQWTLYIVIRVQSNGDKQTGKLLYLLSGERASPSVVTVPLSDLAVDSVTDIMDETEVFSLPETQTRRHVLIGGRMVCAEEVSSDGVRRFVRCDKASLPVRHLLGYLKESYITEMPLE
jgi:hypothetical protein